jgi:hypothetical protein
MYKGGGAMRINLKCNDEGEKIRLTWNWPQEIEQVYIFTNEETGGKLFTLQEYKKRGGAFLRKKHGTFDFLICPFKRENGEDIFFDNLDDNKISFTHKAEIFFSVREKKSPPFLKQQHKNFLISFSSKENIPPNIIRYEKNECDDVIYFFGEEISADKVVTRIVQIENDETLRFFISEEHAHLYNLHNQEEKGTC